MKRQIRTNVFETNSSSVHSLTMCSMADYEKWKEGELWFDKYEDKFITPFDPEEKYAENIDGLSDYNKREFIEECLIDEGIYRNEDEFFESNDYRMDTFVDFYTSESGDKIVAFGYYGYDA